MSISLNRANAYMRHYHDSAALAVPHDPLRAAVFMLCADMCLCAYYAAFHSDAVALVMIGAEEEHNPYTEAMKRKT